MDLPYRLATEHEVFEAVRYCLEMAPEELRTVTVAEATDNLMQYDPIVINDRVVVVLADCSQWYKPGRAASVLLVAAPRGTMRLPMYVRAIEKIAGDVGFDSIQADTGPCRTIGLFAAYDNAGWRSVGSCFEKELK